MFYYVTNDFEYELNREKFIIFQNLISEINVCFQTPFGSINMSNSNHSYKKLSFVGMIWINSWFKRNVDIDKQNIKVKD